MYAPQLENFRLEFGLLYLLGHGMVNHIACEMVFARMQLIRLGLLSKGEKFVAWVLVFCIYRLFFLINLIGLNPIIFKK